MSKLEQDLRIKGGPATLDTQIRQNEVLNADINEHIGHANDVEVFTIRGHRIEVKPDSVIKNDFNDLEVMNLEILEPHVPVFVEQGILLPTIKYKDKAKGQLVLDKLPFGSFPSMSEYFGESDLDHIDPLIKLFRFRQICESLDISSIVKQYGDNNDYEDLVNFVELQRTEQSDTLIDGFVQQVNKLATTVGNIPRVISHRDYTPGNIKTIPGVGCVMLDWSTFGISTVGADEGRWYVHHTLDANKQRDILNVYQKMNNYDQASELSLLLTIGMRSAREYKMLQEGIYYNRHLLKEFPDGHERLGFRGRFEDALLNQISWTNQNLEQL